MSSEAKFSIADITESFVPSEAAALINDVEFLTIKSGSSATLRVLSSLKDCICWTAGRKDGKVFTQKRANILCFDTENATLCWYEAPLVVLNGIIALMEALGINSTPLPFTIKVTRKGSGLKTKYTVVKAETSELDDSLIARYASLIKQSRDTTGLSPLQARIQALTKRYNEITSGSAPAAKKRKVSKRAASIEESDDEVVEEEAEEAEPSDEEEEEEVAPEPPKSKRSRAASSSAGKRASRRK